MITNGQSRKVMEDVDTVISVSPMGEVRMGFYTRSYGVIAMSWNINRQKLVFSLWASDEAKTPALLKQKEGFKVASETVLRDFLLCRTHWELIELPHDKNSPYDFYAPKAKTIKNPSLRAKNLPFNLKVS